jgi:GNAT superfamily N-acetyltransferase
MPWFSFPHSSSLLGSRLCGFWRSLGESCAPPKARRFGQIMRSWDPGLLLAYASSPMRALSPSRGRKVRSPCCANRFAATVNFCGHVTVIRGLAPADRARMNAFFRSHTAETIHDRYGYYFSEMSPEQAKRLVSVDQSVDAALGVFERQVWSSPLIAVGRYCRSAGGDSAEVAFVVREDRRGLGIATTLLRCLVGVARARGLRRLTARVAHNNVAMLTVFRRCAVGKWEELADCDGVKLTLRLKGLNAAGDARSAISTAKTRNGLVPSSRGARRSHRI